MKFLRLIAVLAITACASVQAGNRAVGSVEKMALAPLDTANIGVQVALRTQGIDAAKDIGVAQAKAQADAALAAVLLQLEARGSTGGTVNVGYGRSCPTGVKAC